MRDYTLQKISRNSDGSLHVAAFAGGDGWTHFNIDGFRWADVRGEDGEFPPAPTPDAVDEAVAFDSNGAEVQIEYWYNGEPVCARAVAIAYR